jgi:hypothetical protein
MLVYALIFYWWLQMGLLSFSVWVMEGGLVLMEGCFSMIAEHSSLALSSAMANLSS